MSAVWTLSIKCQWCAATYGLVTFETPGGTVAYTLRSLRREATSVGWVARRGARNRLFDFCPQCAAPRGSGA